MILTHYTYFAPTVDVHRAVDDFGNVVSHTDDVSFAGVRICNVSAWWNAYRFANGVTFEEASMRSLDQCVAEH